VGFAAHLSSSPSCRTWQASAGSGILTIDRAYFDLTGGLDRWLYGLVRKHGGRQRDGWRFDFHHLHQKSGALSPFKRFAFELRDIIRRQPLPGRALDAARSSVAAGCGAFAHPRHGAGCGSAP
jgi:plasmid replication initiation protein